MTDKSKTIDTLSGSAAVKFRDMGDGSHGEVVVASGSGYRSQVSATRPNNTTAYTAGDVVGQAAAVLTFASMGPTGGHVMLTSAKLEFDVASVPSGMTSFRLHLYNATPPSAFADNAAWDLPSGDRANYIGYIDLGSPVDMGSTLFCQIDQINKQVKLGAAETSLYGYLVTNGGYTPGAQDVCLVTLHGVAL